MESAYSVHSYSGKTSILRVSNGNHKPANNANGTSQKAPHSMNGSYAELRCVSVTVCVQRNCNWNESTKDKRTSRTIKS